jgi:hypothetical protein
MDVNLTIRYSDERLCEIVASRPDTAAPLYPPCRPRLEPHRNTAGSSPPLRNHPMAGSTVAVMRLIDLARLQKGGLTVATGVPCAPRIRAGRSRRARSAR